MQLFCQLFLQPQNLVRLCVKRKTETKNLIIFEAFAFYLVYCLCTVWLECMPCSCPDLPFVPYILGSILIINLSYVIFLLSSTISFYCMYSVDIIVNCSPSSVSNFTPLVVFYMPNYSSFFHSSLYHTHWHIACISLRQMSCEFTSEHFCYFTWFMSLCVLSVWVEEVMSSILLH